MLRVERADWQYCYDSACYKDASAVVIVDGRPDPARRTGEEEPSALAKNTFRPSYPTRDIK